MTWETKPLNLTNFGFLHCPSIGHFKFGVAFMRKQNKVLYPEVRLSNSRLASGKSVVRQL